VCIAVPEDDLNTASSCGIRLAVGKGPHPLSNRLLIHPAEPESACWRAIVSVVKYHRKNPTPPPPPKHPLASPIWIRKGERPAGGVRIDSSARSSPATSPLTVEGLPRRSVTCPGGGDWRRCETRRPRLLNAAEGLSRGVLPGPINIVGKAQIAGKEVFARPFYNGPNLLVNTANRQTSESPNSSSLGSFRSRLSTRKFNPSSLAVGERQRFGKTSPHIGGTVEIPVTATLRGDVNSRSKLRRPRGFPNEIKPKEINLEPDRLGLRRASLSWPSPCERQACVTTFYMTGRYPLTISQSQSRGSGRPRTEQKTLDRPSSGMAEVLKTATTAKDGPRP